ncbi:DUF5686 and carboxypeptidase-like regulatory domain-containing protein [Mucilaginibacter myungsuensis]|uniref:Carboxypeptidase-like regulatory domain-containing protein n=1 Tax=Mucilaginibacter myungsuensis TaxID=649104 RepID=A0A929PYB9_9SPHI|nr:DUF5686 and carboxypeptidase-like regulatory domain-containing protein [Mucilaginibacter myungsuensis]MBE9663290.1 carboxypeptidase-like regulatory domain-containing protein [Mucilaginibacter myungsuensis]MDN3600025.1 DUF5686 family protein [Mucilaginibacter myungsuensis]
MQAKAKGFLFILGKLFPLLCFVLTFCPCARAQSVKTYTGKITDAETGEPLPYVTIYVKLPNNTTKGTTTDFSGVYRLVTPLATGDSIYATYVGYILTKKPLPAGRTGTVDFQMKTNTELLKTVTITPKKYINPAWAILDGVVQHKDENNLDKLKSYEYQSYNRLGLSLTNISDKMKQRKVMKQILPLMDSLQKIAGDDGTPNLPVFVSETVTDFYHQHNPDLKTEKIQRTRTSGIGIEDETLVSQIVGSAFQQYNFYKNYVRLAGKDFISPITDSWKMFYNYELVDSQDKIHGVELYRIEFKPKRSHDLAFVGTMWITQDTYALYRLDVSVTPDANLDFLDKIKIQQEMVQPAGSTAWLPEKTRIIVNISNIAKSWSGFIGNFYVANKNFKINQTYPRELFKEPMTMNDSISVKNEDYWVQNRPEPLTATDKRVYQIIDTVKSLPIVKSYTDILGMLINGYYRVGKFGFGPYLYTFSYNDVQGPVLRAGGQTNKYFSDRWILGGYVSYGFTDQRWNYNGSVEYITSRKPWSQVGVSYTHDLNQTGYQFENFNNVNNVFRASARNGRVMRRGPFIQSDLKFYGQTDIWPNWRLRLTGDHRTFEPLYPFNYHSPINGKEYTTYQVAELQTELQWTPGKRVLQSAKINKRIALGNGEDNPVVTFRYTRGFKIFDGDFEYHRFAANIRQKVHMGIWGKGEYMFTGVYLPSILPNPLLENHRFNFNTMRFLEYSSDRYLAFNYQQHMEGLLTNSIPLLKTLNLRTVADLNVLWGSLREENNAGFRGASSGFPNRPSRSLNGIPYVELGYGLENIFKFFRVDLLYRVTHRNHPDEFGDQPRSMAVRFGVQFRL